MAIKAGQILHDVRGFVIDRIQTAGPGNLNIPTEKIYELGNYQTVATIRDIPDLSFDLETLDVSTEIEALMTNKNPSTTVDGDLFDLALCEPIDVLSPFKSAKGAFDIVKGIAVPYLSLESARYQYAVRQNSSEQFSFRGDTVFYVPGTPYQESHTGTTATVYTFAHTALVFDDGGDDVYALSVCLYHSNGTWTRLFHGDDYTDTSTGFTLTSAPASSDVVRVVYGSATAGTYPQTVHQGVSVKPAAIRSKDVDVYTATAAATETFARMRGVQSFEANWRVTLDNDEEFGNSHYVASDYDVADVTGSVTIRARTPQDLFTIINEVTNTPSNQVVGPLTSQAIPVELRVNDPDTGDRIKTLYIPDARFDPPPIQGRVQQKLEVTMNFTSDSGVLQVFKGERP